MIINRIQAPFSCLFLCLIAEWVVRKPWFSYLWYRGKVQSMHRYPEPSLIGVKSKGCTGTLSWAPWSNVKTVSSLAICGHYGILLVGVFLTRKLITWWDTFCICSAFNLDIWAIMEEGWSVKQWHWRIPQSCPKT